MIIVVEEKNDLFERDLFLLSVGSMLFFEADN